MLPTTSIHLTAKAVKLMGGIESPRVSYLRLASQGFKIFTIINRRKKKTSAAIFFLQFPISCKLGNTISAQLEIDEN